MQHRHIISTLFAIAVSTGVIAQDWLAFPGTGNAINSTEYLGANATSTVPLLLKTVPDLSIDFSTSNLLRLRLMPTNTATINTFAGVNPMSSS
ncbi:MAG: hypothetical protein IPP83_01010 [Flavobacteriales bacterium]|nr:hypothetical protein [Flavobacteriales bacterium]